VAQRRRIQRRRLAEHLSAVRPDIVDPTAEIAAGRVLVDGRIVTNPASMVPRDASIVVRGPLVFRGEAKLRAAFAAFKDVRIAGRVALDAGAAAGGFTRVLLATGARRVYAVDAGHGQLLGSLRQDPRVVNLEATNLADLDRRLVPDVVEVVTLDLSYLGLGAAAGELRRVALADDADLVALVKPVFELKLAAAPTDHASVDAAVARAAQGIADAGWEVIASAKSPVRGARGAVEGFVRARRRAP
jgi:23S rRNA (cytidine1920-2'-O)/16S rRNA (cytidine1409-2'-O)-methyltransferase